MTSLTPRQVNDLPNGLMAAGEGLTQLYEFAEGQRRELERRGWSPAVAEALAADMLARVIAVAFEVKE